jgi:hypothetical protein
VEPNDQVVFREKLQNCTRVRTGTIVSVNGDKALVAIQDDNRKGLSINATSRREIPLKQLTPVSVMFNGRKVVQRNPTFRHIAKANRGAHGCLANMLYR